jgi:nitrogenase subunit NifH
MSNDKVSEAMKDFKLKQAEEAELIKKEADLKQHRINTQYSQLEEHRKSLGNIKNMDFSSLNETEIESIQEEYEQEESLQKQRRTFIRPEFASVPHGPYQIILVGALTGTGKSTTAANLALGTINDGKKVLLITNEEHPHHSYNRVSALQQGLSFGPEYNKDEITKKLFKDNIKVLAKNMRVVHENYGGISGVTTTIEGILGVLDQILDSYKKTGEYFDTVIFDYYQNIKTSTENVNLNEFQVQRIFTSRLNQFKKLYPASFVVLAQMKPETKDKEGNIVDFKTRIEGNKDISNIATCSIEMKARPEDRTTEWIIRKNRWQSDNSQARILTGWEKGRYVKHDLDFMEKIEKEKLAKFGNKPQTEGS